MRRTYRFKKDTGGALDPRDVLFNLDEKSSAFDAFYIQNIKQTKRELSTIGSSNHYNAASNRVRKRKYVKRIVKETEPSRKESQSHSVFLTPDKSIRVNKALDPFDMLLNSSPATTTHQKTDETDSGDKSLPMRRPAITYTRKKQPKKVNYSHSDSTDSDKENSGELSNTVQNVTDIKSHQLLVERETYASPKVGDESINNIVKKLSILNNIKRGNLNESFKTPKFNKFKLMRNIQSPIMQKSPFCSTPFKEKYRSQSIYKFSPIVTASTNASPNLNNTQESNISNDSVIIVGKKTVLGNVIQSPITLISENNVGDKINISTDRQEERIGENNSLEELLKVNANVSDKQSSVLCDSNNLPSNEISTLHNTEMEPFFGFSSNEANDLITKKNKIEILCKKAIDSNIEECEEFDDPSDAKSTQLSQESEKFSSNNNGSDYDISEISCHTENDDNESMYDTCDSEQLSESNIASMEPIVKVEKMSNSLFLKYYEIMQKNLHNDDSKNSEKLGENSKCDESYYENSVSESSTELTDDMSSHDNTDVSTTEDATTSQDTDSSSNNEEQHVGFVTTRRRNGGTGNSTVSFFNNSYSESGELEKTVLSICNSKTQETDLNHSSNIEGSKIETNNSHTERRRSFVKRRRRRYSKSNCDVDNPVYTDSDDNTNEVSLYALATTIENPDETILSQHRKSVNRRSRKTRISQVTDDQNSTNIESSNIDKLTSDEITSVTISDNPPESIDSDDVIENTDSKKLDNTQKNNEENSEKAIYIVSSVSGSSDNDVTLHAEPPDKCHTVKSLGDQELITNTRKSTRLSKRNTLISKPRHQNCKSSISNNNTEDNLKNSVNNSRFSSITRKTSRLFNESIDRNQASSRTLDECKPGIVLQPGKKWERSLSIYRRMTMMTDQFNQSLLDESLQTKGRKYRQSVISMMEMQDTIGSVHNESTNSRRSTFVSKPSRSTIRIVNDFNSTRTSLNNTTVFDELQGFLADDCDDTIVELSKLSIADAEPGVTVLELHDTSNRLATARDYVLRRCNQTDAILFDECYPDTVLKNCHKIGEGVYGEVFLWRARDGRARVMKIVPVAGSIKVNGEDQKDFSEIISEIVIAMELSALRAPIADIERHFDEGNDATALDLHTIENATDVFNEVLAVRCVQGNYPSRLLDLWDLYDECKGSENDNPAILPDDQQYIVLELANAGQDLESYQFNNAEQAYALFYQVAFGLAVGEEAYQFEHRDLHWGNVLIAPTDQKYATFVLRGRVHRVCRRGVGATIIDYSLSRVALRSAGAGAGGAVGAALYNDLAADDGLFDAVGDYQFQVYRLMRDKLGNDWKNFEPYTNILWLHYMVDKMITALRYKRTNTKIHKHYIEKLKGIKNRILDYKSAAEFVLVDNEY